MILLGKFEDNVYPKKEITHSRVVSRGIILNENNEILMLNIKRDDQFDICSHLETPGGGIEENESLEEGLIRELQEEVGKICTIICPIGKIEDDYNIINRHNISNYFLVKEVANCNESLQENEKILFQGHKYYPIDELITILSSPKSKVDKLIYQRELVIIKKVKEILGV